MDAKDTTEAQAQDQGQAQAQAKAQAAAQGVDTPATEAGAKPKSRTKPNTKPKAGESAAPRRTEKLINGERTAVITLHDSPEIPPNGQFVGVNGRQYVIKPGVRVRVPLSVLDVLNNAVQSVPELNDKMQVVGMRAVPRLTYTLHMDEEA